MWRRSVLVERKSVQLLSSSIVACSTPSFPLARPRGSVPVLSRTPCSMAPARALLVVCALGLVGASSWWEPRRRCMVYRSCEGWPSVSRDACIALCTNSTLPEGCYRPTGYVCSYATWVPDGAGDTPAALGFCANTDSVCGPETDPTGKSHLWHMCRPARCPLCSGCINDCDITMGENCGFDPHDEGRCMLCVGQNQRKLRSMGCSAADVANFCAKPEGKAVLATPPAGALGTGYWQAAVELLATMTPSGWFSGAPKVV